jgi:hypothetical protein
LVKQHIIFLTDSLSSNLGSSINFYIYFLILIQDGSINKATLFISAYKCTFN